MKQTFRDWCGWIFEGILLGLCAILILAALGLLVKWAHADIPDSEDVSVFRGGQHRSVEPEAPGPIAQPVEQRPVRILRSGRNLWVVDERTGNVIRVCWVHKTTQVGGYKARCIENEKGT